MTFPRSWSSPATKISSNSFMLLLFAIILAVTAHPRECSHKPIDLLSSERYQLRLNWSLLASKGVQVFHRVCNQAAYKREVLVSLADFLCQCRAELGSIERDKWYAVEGGACVGFEWPMNANYEAAREKPSASTQLFAEYPRLRVLPTGLLEPVRRAESSWRQVERLSEFDFGAIVVSFGRAAEAFWRNRLQLPESTLGELAARLRHGRLAELVRLRNDGAHGTNALTRKDVIDARKLALDSIDEGLTVRTLRAGGG